MNLLKNEWEAKHIEHALAKGFVEKHHYGHGCGNTGMCFGLYYKGDSRTLHGVAMWQPPAYGAALHANPINPGSVCSLSRFCLRDDRPDNSGSFLISKTIKMLETKKGKKYDMLVTYADLACEHEGIIYKASNWAYNGLTRERYVYWEERDGKQVMVSRKRGPKTYSHQEMINMGYRPSDKKYPMHRFIYPTNRKQRSFKCQLAYTKEGKIINLKNDSE